MSRRLLKFVSAKGSHKYFLTATVTATPVDVRGRSNTIQHDDPWHSSTQQHAMDLSGRIETKLARTSKPLVDILGDVDGRIVPVAPPPFGVGSRAEVLGIKERLDAAVNAYKGASAS